MQNSPASMHHEISSFQAAYKIINPDTANIGDSITYAQAESMTDEVFDCIRMELHADGLGLVDNGSEWEVTDNDSGDNNGFES